MDGNWQKQFKFYDYLGSLRFTMKADGTLLNFKQYAAFGETTFDTLGITRQGYIGKEKDPENSFGDHGVRKYDYETGRFNSVDPLFEKYYGWSPYQYCMNNPIWAKDWDGRYFHFVNERISERDKSTFNNNLEVAKLSVNGAILVQQLSDSPYPIFVESMNNKGNIIGYGGAKVDKNGEISFGQIVIDFNKSPNILNTQLEEMIHVQQVHIAPDKQAYQEQVTKDTKTLKYEDRPHEIDAKAKVKRIVIEIGEKQKELSQQPKVQFNQLPNQK